MPKMYQAEAFKRGCVPIEVDLDETEQDELIPVGDKKISEIVEAIRKMLNDGCKLSGAGLPNLKELSAIVGFHVTKLEAHEAWNILEAEI